jgi:hypothetical protein
MASKSVEEMSPEEQVNYYKTQFAKAKKLAKLLDDDLVKIKKQLSDLTISKHNIFTFSERRDMQYNI